MKIAFTVTMGVILKEVVASYPFHETCFPPRLKIALIKILYHKKSRKLEQNCTNCREIAVGLYEKARLMDAVAGAHLGLNGDLARAEGGVVQDGSLGGGNVLHHVLRPQGTLAPAAPTA